MSPDAGGRGEHERFRRIHAAFRAGDIDDDTALHRAAAEGNRAAADVLLAAGADRRLRTRSDDCETPCELAERAGLVGIARLLAAKEAELPEVTARTPTRPDTIACATAQTDRRRMAWTRSSS